jgi:hypothetical protein
MPRPARNNTDKIDADKLCQALKAQVLSGVQQIVPVILPPEEIQELRSLFSTFRLYRTEYPSEKPYSLPCAGAVVRFYPGKDI